MKRTTLHINPQFTPLTSDYINLTSILSTSLDIPSSHAHYVNQLTTQRNDTLRPQPYELLISSQVIYINTLLSVFPFIPSIPLSINWKNSNRRLISPSLLHELLCQLYNTACTYLSLGNYSNSLAYLLTAMDIAKELPASVLTYPELQALCRTIKAFLNIKKPHDALIILGDAPKVLKNEGNEDKQWAFAIEAILLGKYATEQNPLFKRIAYDYLKNVDEFDGIDENLKVNMLRFGAEIGKGKYEKRELFWDRFNNVDGDRIKKKEVVHANEQLLPGGSPCWFDVNQLLEKLDVESIKKSIRVMQENLANRNPCYMRFPSKQFQSFRIEKDIESHLLEIQSYSEVIIKEKQVINNVLLREDMNNINDITSRFHSRINALDVTVSTENDQNPSNVINKSYYDTLSIATQLFVINQALNDKVKEAQNLTNMLNSTRTAEINWMKSNMASF
ncbi:Uncharacterized protein QTN25_008397 [Entamoeba marina]